MSEQSPQPAPPVKPKRPWPLRWWAWVLYAVALLIVIPLIIGIVGAITNPTALTADDLAPDQTQSATPTTAPTPTPTSTPMATHTATAKPTPKPKPSPTSTTLGQPPVEVDGTLSYTVWSSVLENYGGKISSSSPLYPTTRVEDITSNTIRVYVQETLTKAQRVNVARNVYNLGAWDNTDLEIVVVRDVTGVDSNHYRSNFPGIKQ